MTDNVSPILQAMEFIDNASHGKTWIERKSKDGQPAKPGRWYPTVALRVEAFRRFFDVADWGITTEIVTNNEVLVIIRASVVNFYEDHSDVVATGTAEEVRGSSYINKTSALENAETSAIGRALASFGLHGGEMASANEIEQATEQREIPMATKDQLDHAVELLGLLAMDEAETAKSLRVEKLAELTEARATRLLTRLTELNNKRLEDLAAEGDK